MKKAIDVVILPPDHIMDFAIGINKPWIKGINKEIALDKKTCLPHITLAMGVIDEKQIDEVRKAMEKIAKHFTELVLTITAAETHNSSENQTMSGLVVERSAALQKLHQNVMDILVPMFSYDDITKEMFYSPPSIDELPQYWVKNYVTTKVRKNYHPHITLGLGEVEPLKQPIKFKATRFSLCHLGVYCTCREILAEVKINPENKQ